MIDNPAGPSVSGQPTPTTVDLDAIEEKWLRQCGACDAGMGTSCVCAEGDPRNVIANLVDEVKRLRGALANARAVSAVRIADRDKVAHDLIRERDEALSALRLIADRLDIAQSATPALIADLTVRYVDGAAANLGAALERAEAAHERLSTLSGIADGERELRAAQLERERDSLREELARLVAEVKRIADEVRRDGGTAMGISQRLVRALAAAPEAGVKPQPPNLNQADSGSSPHGCDGLCEQAAEHGLHPPAAPVQPEERADAADELDEALADAMSAIEWAANHISLARSCARAALGSTPDTGEA